MRSLLVLCLLSSCVYETPSHLDLGGATDATCSLDSSVDGFPPPTVQHRTILLVGNSNSIGKGISSLVGLSDPYPNVGLAQHIEVRLWDPIIWSEYPLGALRPRPPSGPTGTDSGIELALGRRVDTMSVGGGWIILKMAVDGSGQKLHWDPNAMWPTMPVGGPNLNSQITPWVSSVGLPGPVGYLVLDLGHKDGSSLVNSQNFAENVDVWDRVLSAQIGDYLLIVIQHSIHSTTFYRDIIRSEQDQLMTICRRCVKVGTDQRSLTDGAHWGTVDLEGIGNDVGDTILAN